MSERLNKSLQTAESESRSFFEVMSNTQAYDFEKVEVARQKAIQALREVQQLIDINWFSGVSGANDKSLNLELYETYLKRISKNVDIILPNIKPN